MIKKIDESNKIFHSKNFECDKVLFNVFLKNLSNSSVELYSDEENFVFCRGPMGVDNWIWTKDNIDDDLIFEIKDLLDTILSDK